jgi:hypothetical protein
MMDRQTGNQKSKLFLFVPWEGRRSLRSQEHEDWRVWWAGGLTTPKPQGSMDGVGGQKGTDTTEQMKAHLFYSTKYR